MRSQATAACIAILAGLAGLLQYTLLQMVVVSDLYRSLSIEATYTVEFLGEHVQFTKPTEEKVTVQKGKKVMDTSMANLSMVG